MTLTIKLDAHSIAFIDEQLRRGDHADAGAVMTAGLRLLQEQTLSRQASLHELQNIIAEGLDEDGDLPATAVFDRLDATYRGMADAHTAANRKPRG